VPDIDVTTGDLREFAGQQLQVRMDGVAQAASEAVASPGLMIEARRLGDTSKVATQNVVKYLTAVNQGMAGYKAAVSKIADVYDSSEGRVVKTLNDVMPQDQRLPEIDRALSQPIQIAEAKQAETTRHAEAMQKKGN
jgi:hypothetical protein